jgi:hypothetical protein
MRVKVLLVAALAVVGAWLLLRPRTMVRVRSSITGKEYVVRRGPDAQAMADRLAQLEHSLHRLLEGASALMPDDPRIMAIRRRWDGTLSESEARDEVAFSVDKRSIHVCLRDPSGGLEDLNASMFVLLHELAHVATADYGHSPEFWANMRFLLELAERLGVYRYETHDSRTTFCGQALGTSPLSCVKDRTCVSSLEALK